MSSELHSAIGCFLPLFIIFSSWNYSPVLAQFASSFPSPMPIITKTAYLNSWLQINSTFSTDQHTPVFWGRQDLGWMTAIRVDGTSYSLTGSQDGFKVAPGLAAAITPTRSVFTMQAGSVNVNLTYLSPIEPSDWVLQSLPFGYLSIDVWSTDDQSHSVQLYSDISGQWVSGNQGNVITWDTTSTDKSMYHQAARQNKAAMGEIQGFAEDATVYLAMPLSTPSLTRQTASYTVSRPTFMEKGKLDNTADTAYRAIGKDYPVLAFAADLGNLEKTESPTIFALGLVRDPVITYRKTERWKIGLPSFAHDGRLTVQRCVQYITDFSEANSRAADFDAKIMSDAGKISTNYSDVIAASLRQIMAPLEFTTAPNGGLDSDVRIFLKDLGTSDRINPVDTLYAAFPAYLYLNASLAGHLLEPLLEFQSSSGYSNTYAAPDLGTWPNALGNSTDQKALAVENCGSMLVMALAHAQKSGDGSLIRRYYKLLKGWADYLVTNTLVPTAYLSADDTSSTTSNLALKGIIGIWAMSKINEALEATGTQNNLTESYLVTAKDYAKQWQTRAFVGDHIASDYGGSTNWGLIYNLYAPKLLNSDLIPQNLQYQASWYLNQVPKAPTYGFPFDQSASNTAKAHWTLLTAASVAKSPVMDILISNVHQRTFSQLFNNFPNPSTYDTSGASEDVTGKASPAMGAAFSLLALSLPDRKIEIGMSNDTFNGTPNGSSSKKNVGPIVGGVLGGLAVLLLIVIAAFFIHRRRQKNQKFKRVPMVTVRSFFANRRRHNIAPVMTPLQFGRNAKSTGFTSSTVSRSDVTSSVPSPIVSSFRDTYLSDSYAGDSKASMFPDHSIHLHNHIPLMRMGANPSNPQTSPFHNDDLRTEVAQLRREIYSIRRGEDLPPPIYTD